MKPHHALFLVLSFTSAPAAAQSTLAKLNGSPAEAHLGSAMDAVGDLDGDGWPDVAVGLPGASTGKVQFVSGRWVDTGSGPQLLSMLAGPANASGFGTSLTALGDVTGDGVPDLAVGLPAGASASTGAVELVSGATRTIVAEYALGMASGVAGSLTRCGDVDGDGYEDVAFTVYGTLINPGSRVEVVSLRKKLVGGTPLLKAITLVNDSEHFVTAGDLDGDGKQEIVVGNPDSGTGGTVQIFKGPTFALWRTLVGAAGSRFGSSLDASRDVDGDGYADLIVGAPQTTVAGKVVGQAILHSGLRITNMTQPWDVATWSGTQTNEYFGYAVRLVEDVNGDGAADLLLSAPDYDSFPGILMHNGRVQMVSGKTFEILGTAVGASDELLGLALGRAGDIDGDQRSEICAGAPYDSTVATNGGALRVISLFPALPAVYCTGKVNSQGCTPAIAYTGSPSLSSPTPFAIKCGNVINKKVGLLIYGYDAAAKPFQSGLLCIDGLVKRTSGQGTGGNAGADDCSGAMSYDFNALIQSGSDPLIAQLGAQVFAQYWSRDPNAPSLSCLSNALRFVVNP